MTTPYYRNFKEAPDGLLDSIEELTDVDIAYGHVGVDNSLFLDLIQTDDKFITAKQILLVAAAVGADLDDAFVEPSQLVDGGLSVSFAATMFDFSASYRGTPEENSPFFGVGLHDGEVRPEASPEQQALVARLQQVIDEEGAPDVQQAIAALDSALNGLVGELQDQSETESPFRRIMNQDDLIASIVRANEEDGVGGAIVIDNGDGSGMILIVGDEDDGDVVAFNESEIPGPVVFFDDEDLLPPSPEAVDSCCFDGSCAPVALPGVEDSPEGVQAAEALIGLQRMLDDVERNGYRPPAPAEAQPSDEAGEALFALLLLAALLEGAGTEV